MTQDTTLLMAAFLLGFLIGRIPSMSWYWSLRREIRMMKPRRCSQCGKWGSMQSLKPEFHRTAGYVLLCSDCHANLFSPFSDGKHDDEEVIS